VQSIILFLYNIVQNNMCFYFTLQDLSDHYKEAITYITRKHLIKLLHDGKIQNTTNENVWAIGEK